MKNFKTLFEKTVARMNGGKWTITVIVDEEGDVRYELQYSISFDKVWKGDFWFPSTKFINTVCWFGD